jgi:hypothetical protein
VAVELGAVMADQILVILGVTMEVVEEVLLRDVERVMVHLLLVAVAVDQVHAHLCLVQDLSHNQDGLIQPIRCTPLVVLVGDLEDVEWF